MSRRRRLMWKRLAIATGVVAVIAGLGYATYRIRAAQIVRAAKAQAFAAAEQGDVEQAVKLMQKYIAAYPDEAATVRDLVAVLERTSKHPSDGKQILILLDRALQLNPDDTQTRRIAVRKALELHRYKEARDHLTIMIRDMPNDPELELMMGQSAEGEKWAEEAAKHYAQAIRMDPKLVAASVRQARLLRFSLDQPTQADAVMTELRGAAPHSVEARLALNRYFVETGRLAEGQSDIEHAIQLAPDSAEVRYQAALHEIERDRPMAAEEHVRHGLAKNPNHLALLRLAGRKEIGGTATPTNFRDLIRQTIKQLEENPRRTADVLDLLIDVRELDLAREVLSGPKNDWLPGYARDFLEARLKIAEEDFVRARELLERCRARLAPVPELARHAHLLLGICQRRLGDPAQAVRSLRTALDIAANWIPAQLELAAVEAERGRLDEALAMYRKLLPQFPEVRAAMARLMIASQRRLPPDRRDWTPVDELLEQAGPDQRRNAAWRMARAELLSARGKEAAARLELEAAIRDDPKSPAPRVALSNQLIHHHELSEATEVLVQANKVLGDRVELRLARANLIVAERANGASGELEKLVVGSNRFARSEQIRLLSGLYRLCATIDPAGARRLGNKLVELQPTRIDLQIGLLRLALSQSDESAAREIARKLRELEGEVGAGWRCAQAAIPLQFAPASDSSWIAAARNHASEAARLRPEWGLPALILARLDEREGNIDAALPRYRSAIELGERAPGVVRRAIQLMQERGRFEDAQELLVRLGGSFLLDVDLSRMSLSAVIGREPPEQTLAKARQLAPESSKNFRDHLWLGQLLQTMGNQPIEAEAAFRRAVSAAPHSGEPWVALIQYLVVSRQPLKAAGSLAEAESRLKGDESAVALSACLELVGRKDDAEKVLTAAIKAKPSDVLRKRQLAALLLRANDVKRAEPILAEIISSKSNQAGWARRQRAMILARSGNFAQVRDGLAIIEQNLKESGSNPEDLRARAILLALHPHRRGEALRAMEESLRSLPASGDEQLLLARLYDAIGDWAAARDRLQITASGSATPAQLEECIVRVLAHAEFPTAGRWLEKLEKLEPGSWRTTSLKARLLARTGREAEAKSLLREPIVAAPDAQQVLAAARLLEDLGFAREAEQGYRRYQLREAHSGPSAEWPLARFLAIQGKLDESLSACERMGDAAAPEAAALIASAIVRANKVTPQHASRLEAWLGSVRKKHPQSAIVLLAVADFFEQRDRPSDAERTYEELLAREANHVAALNNYAALLALRGHGARALKLANQAIELAGPQAALLDTRGLAHFAVGDTKAALADFEEAVAQQDTPTRRFHLALAHKAAGNDTPFAENVQRAKEKKLAEAALHPLERRKWREIGG